MDKDSEGKNVRVSADILRMFTGQRPKIPSLLCERGGWTTGYRKYGVACEHTWRKVRNVKES